MLGAYLMSRKKWMRYFVFFLLGFIMALAQAPFDFSLVYFFVLPFLGFFIRDLKDKKTAFKIGWWTGFGYFGFTIIWIIEPFLVEPKITRLEDGAIKPWKNIKRIIRYALVEKSILRAYIFYSAIVGVATLTMAWFAQPYLKTLNIGIVYFGIIGAGLNLAVAITSFYAHEIERKINTRILFSLILLFIVSGYFTIAYLNNLWGLSILILFYMTRGVATPLLRDYMNRHTPSEMRATVMSIRSFVIRIFFASTSPMLGYVADVYSLQNALYLSGALFFVFGLLILIYLISESNAQSIDPPTATQV